MVAWRQTGEFVSQYFTKGRMAVVEGRLQIRDWTDKDGNKRRSAEVVADNVYFGDSKRDSDAAYMRRRSTRPPAATAAPAAGYGAPVRRRPALPRSTRRTASCRSDVTQVLNLYKGGYFHGYGT